MAAGLWISPGEQESRGSLEEWESTDQFLFWACSALPHSSYPRPTLTSFCAPRKLVCLKHLNRLPVLGVPLEFGHSLILIGKEAGEKELIYSSGPFLCLAEGWWYLSTKGHSSCQMALSAKSPSLGSDNQSFPKSPGSPLPALAGFPKPCSHPVNNLFIEIAPVTQPEWIV